MANRGSNLLLVNNPIGYSEVYSNVSSYPSQMETVTNTPAEPAQVDDKMQSSPVSVWMIAIGLFVLVILLARYATPGEGFGEQFRNIKPSVFNIFFIVLVVAVGLPLFKIAAAKIPNQSVKSYLLAV